MEKYELAELDYKNGMKYKDIADRYSVSLNTVKSWKQRYKWCKDVKKKVCTQKKGMHPKKIKEIAKTLIEEGHSLKEVSELTGAPKSTIANWSAKEKLQQSQLEYLKQFREKYKERIEQNKLTRLGANEEALEAISYEMNQWRNSGKISKAAMEKLIMNEEAEQLIFGLDRIEKLEKLELEKIKIAPEETKHDPITIVDDIGDLNEN
ncbi:MAG: helix-turn-helix domain-containing protein [Cetobacterium sp.]